MERAKRFPHLFPVLKNPETAQEMLFLLAQVNACAWNQGPCMTRAFFISDDLKAKIGKVIEAATR